MSFLGALHYSFLISIDIGGTIVGNAYQVRVLNLQGLVLVVKGGVFLLVHCVNILVIQLSLVFRSSFSASTLGLRIHSERSILVVTSLDA
jgi:hypothetical protein